jgi:hypothetical protein
VHLKRCSLGPQEGVTFEHHVQADWWLNAFPKRWDLCKLSPIVRNPTTSHKIDALPLSISASPSYIFHSSTWKVGFAKMLRHGNGNKYSQAPLPSQTFPGSKSQTFQTSKSTADISLASDRTNTSGPNQSEPALITSKWNFGWQVPTVILASYAAGINSHEKIMILFLTIKFSYCNCTCPPHPIQIH